MIKVENLTKYYGSTAAIRNVSFQVNKGEVLGFLGPNAAGKTTTMRILTCFMAPTSGTASVGGFDILEDSLEVRKRIGYLPETAPLYREMTVRGFLAYCARLRRVEKDEIDDRVDEAMAKSHVVDRADSIIYTLSKGYRQRVGIAQALVHNPDVLVLDEPTIGLDPAQIRETRSLIRELGKDHTIILSTHILPEVSMTCSRVIIIDQGEIVAVDTPDNLTSKLQKSETIVVRVKRPPEDILDRLQQITGVTQVRREDPSQKDGAFVVESRLGTDVREDVARLVVNSDWGLLEMRHVELSLEDIFLQLTTKEEGVDAHA